MSLLNKSIYIKKQSAHQYLCYSCPKPPKTGTGYLYISSYIWKNKEKWVIKISLSKMFIKTVSVFNLNTLHCCPTVVWRSPVWCPVAVVSDSWAGRYRSSGCSSRHSAAALGSQPAPPPQMLQDLHLLKNMNSVWSRWLVHGSKTTASAEVFSEGLTTFSGFC